MAKTKISEFDTDPSNNTDINSINIAEGCAPSGINNAIRQLMSDLKEWQNGSSGDSMTVAGTLNVTGGLQLDGSAGTSGQVLLSAGSGSTPTWGSGFPSGGIILWSGAADAIPSGWVLCNGSNSTPDLRNRFVIGAGSTYAVGATGGSADAITVSHTHTVSGTTGDGGSHYHSYQTGYQTNVPIQGSNGNFGGGTPDDTSHIYYSSTVDAHTHSFSATTASTGSSGTGANLPPYYALCYIMKS